MWTPITRAQHNRDHLRFPSDLTDEEWEILAPLMPPPCPVGRKRRWPWRDVLGGVFYVLRGGIQWRIAAGLLSAPPDRLSLVRHLTRRRPV
jgi:putative transposase